MDISTKDQQLLRQCAKDDDAYETLLALFKRLPGEPAPDTGAKPPTTKSATGQMRERSYVLLQAIPDLIFHFSGKGYYLSFQGNVNDLYQPLDVLIGSHVDDVLPPDLAELTTRKILQTLRTQEMQTYEYTLDIPQKGTRHYEVRMVPAGTDEVIAITRDVTERLEMEMALRASEERMRTILDNIPVMISFIDHQGNVEFTNRQWVETLGWGAEDLAEYDDPFSLFYPDPSVYQQVLAFIQSGLKEWKDFQTTTRDRGVIATSWANVQLSDGSLIGIGQDVTGRKQMEVDLRASEERMRALLKVIPDLIFRVSGDGRYLDYFAADESALYVQPDDLLNKTVLETMPPDLGQRIMEYIEQTLTTGEMHSHEYQLKIPELGWRDYEGRMLPSGADEVTVIIRDITERKQMDARLHRYRNIIASTDDSISLVNRDYIYEIVNDAYLVRNQKKRGEIEGHHAVDLFGEEVFKSIIKPQFDRCLAGETVSYVNWFEYAGLGRRYMHVTYSPYRNHQGEIEGVVANIRDITVEKEAQQRELDLQLEKDRRQLLATFIQNAAHEFRTPLSTINTSTHILAHSDDRERRMKKSAQVLHQVQRMTRLIDMMLMVVKLEKNSIDLTVEVDIRQLLEDVCHHQMEAHGTLPLDCELPASLPAVSGDAILLTEAFNQLLDNAYRFTPEGGSIRLRAEADVGEVRVIINDTGLGIPSDTLPQVFELFWRQDAAHSTPGFGLGLTIARRIIDRHGGTITVKSVEGEGSQFSVVLPTAKA